MNKQSTHNIIMTVAAVILTVSVIMCVKSIVGFAGTGFTDTDNYETGDATITETVKNLEVDWTSGSITVEYHKENTVIISESAKKKISDDKRMIWQLDGDTLRIRFSKPHFIELNSQKKDLTITLPEDLVLDDVNIDATSATLDIPSLQADTLKMDITSGDICVSADARVISGNTTSGNLTLSAGSPEDLRIDSTSGNIYVDAAETGTVSINSTSGDVHVEVDSFNKLNIDVTSGDVTAVLPAEPGFTANLDTTSGRIDYQLPLAKEDDAYVCGDGSGEVSIDTTSGNITIG